MPATTARTRADAVALTRKAARDPDRPGDGCKAEPGAFKPLVTLSKCEGKGDCVTVCPYDVFEVGTIEPEVFAAQPLLTRLKLWVHGRKTAYTPNVDACRACGLCVVACPEQAIRLVSLSESAA